MKIYISCDMEGTAGIVAWDETEIDKSVYPHWANQMSREVAAACEGAIKGGADEILVKDAHDFARNVNPDLLPEQARIFRGWGRCPASMMAAVEQGFDGAVYTGYHSGAGMDTNPLSHTMNTCNMTVKCNGRLMPEAVINAMTASYFGVPSLCITGDKGICEYMKSFEPEIETVPVSEGNGAGSVSLQPDLAVKRIREGVERAMRKPKEACMFPLPEHFHIEICFKDHAKARWASYYPGVKQTGTTTIEYDADDYMDVLVMMHYLL